MLPSRAALAAHRDEAQVALDVQRSFVLYTETQDAHVRDARRRQLDAVLRGTLRAYPVLHYYQGFHDVASLVVLTLAPALPPDGVAWTSTRERALVQRAVDRVALHVVRDSMASDLTPVLGQLKIVRNMVRAADLPYALALEHAFAPAQVLVALPWVLTLLTHDVPTLPIAQRVLDYVLSHGPASILYICAAILLQRKAALAADAAASGTPALEDLDAAQLHHTLARVPPLDADACAALLAHADTLRRTYPLRCPAVRAHTVLAGSSVLFTDDPACTDSAALTYAALPGRAHALDAAPTPREDAPVRLAAPRVRVARVPRVLLVRRLVPFLARRAATVPLLLAASLSLLFGGSVLSVVLAVQLAAAPP